MLRKLQYISQGKTSSEQMNNITEALNAGCKWIQLRFKNANEDEIAELGVQVKMLCKAQAATFIINDHPYIAKAIDADGVHVGLNDMEVGEAKKIMDAGKIIGGTANRLEDVLQRVKEGCTYIGLGPFRFTTTKEKLSPVLGLKGYTEIMKMLAAQNISVPVYGVGGIILEDVPEIMKAGIYGVAVSGIITTHPDKKLLIQQFNTFLNETINN